jgi:hypothetical protein
MPMRKKDVPNINAGNERHSCANAATGCGSSAEELLQHVRILQQSIGRIVKLNHPG